MIAAASTAVVVLGLAVIAVMRVRARAERRLESTLRRIGDSMETLSGALGTIVERAAAPTAARETDRTLSLDLDDVVAAVAQDGAQCVGADGAAVEVRRVDGTHILAAHGMPGPEGTLESAFETPDRRPWHAVRLEWSPDPRGGAGAVRSGLVVPVDLDGERLGTIAVYARSAGAFAPEHEDTLRRLATEVAPAIANARLHAATLELVTTDALTGLRNRRGYDDVLELEVARAQRSGRPLALIEIDLDDFRAVNTRFGHPAGDDVLAVLGGVLRRTARLTDAVCRRGGEEFALVLPETPCAEAIRLYARLRAEVELTAFPHAGEMTFSAGLTELRPGDTVRSLDERASRLLFDAKEAGKNRLIHDCNGPDIPPSDSQPE